MKPNPFKRRREQLNMTQRQIAESFMPPLSQSTVGCWELGVAAPRRVLIGDVARVYRQTREWAEAARAFVTQSREAGKVELVAAK